MVFWAKEGSTKPQLMRLAWVLLPLVPGAAWRWSRAKLLSTSRPERVATTYNQGWVPPSGRVGLLFIDVIKGRGTWRIEYDAGLAGRADGAQLRFLALGLEKLEGLAERVAADCSA